MKNKLNKVAKKTVNVICKFVSFGKKLRGYTMDGIYNTATDFIDYSTSTENRKRIIASMEIGLSVFFMILGITTITSIVEPIETEVNYEQ